MTMQRWAITLLVLAHVLSSLFTLSAWGNSAVPCKSTTIQSGVKLCVSAKGNINYFGPTSAAPGNEFIAAEGYAVCNAVGEFPLSAYDFGVKTKDWKAPQYMQPNGPGIAPIVVVRKDVQDQLELTQEIDFNIPARSVWIAMKLKNVTNVTQPQNPVTVSNITLRRAFFRASPAALSARSALSVAQWMSNNKSHGLMMSDATISADPVPPMALKIVPATAIEACNAASYPTATIARRVGAAAIDYAIGSLKPGESKWVRVVLRML